MQQASCTIWQARLTAGWGSEKQTSPWARPCSADARTFHDGEPQPRPMQPQHSTCWHHSMPSQRRPAPASCTHARTHARTRAPAHARAPGGRALGAAAAAAARAAAARAPPRAARAAGAGAAAAAARAAALGAAAAADRPRARLDGAAGPARGGGCTCVRVPNACVRASAHAALGAPVRQPATAAPTASLAHLLTLRARTGLRLRLRRPLPLSGLRLRLRLRDRPRPPRDPPSRRSYLRWRHRTLLGRCWAIVGPLFSAHSLCSVHCVARAGQPAPGSAQQPGAPTAAHCWARAVVQGLRGVQGRVLMFCLVALHQPRTCRGCGCGPCGTRPRPRPLRSHRRPGCRAASSLQARHAGAGKGRLVRGGVVGRSWWGTAAACACSWGRRFGTAAAGAGHGEHPLACTCTHACTRARPRSALGCAMDGRPGQNLG